MNHYEALGLPRTATSDQIRERYRQLVRTHHPDVNSATNSAAAFRRIVEAYEALSDAERRWHYDKTLELELQPASEMKQPPVPRASSRTQAAPTPDVGRLLALTSGWLVVICLAVSANVVPGSPLPIFSGLTPFVAGWSLNLMLLMLAAGGLSGALLRFAGSPPPDEPWNRLNRIILLAAVTAIQFWAGVAVYVVIGLLKGGYSAAVSRALFVAAGLTMLFAAAYEPAPLQTIILGGNIISLAILGGWTAAKLRE